MTTGYTHLPLVSTSGGGGGGGSGNVAYQSILSFTRPANTTSYGATDVIGIADSVTPANAGSAIHAMASIGPNNGYIQITTAEVTVEATTIPGSLSAMRLHLYTASPTGILDNAVFSANAVDALAYRGSIDVPMYAIDGGFLFGQANLVGIAMKLTGTSLFVVMQNIGSFAPTSGQNYSIKLRSIELGTA
jgi:hypothetical protein